MDPSLPLTASQALALGNPAMCLLFALGFACIWAHERPRTYLLLYAAAFAVYAAGTLLRIFDRPDATGDDLAAAVLYVGSALLLARGLFARCGIDADGSPLGALGIALLVLLLHFHIMQNDVPAFAYTLGVGMGALLLLAWMRLGKLRRGAAADQVLYWVLPFVSAGLFLGISWVAGSTPHSAGEFVQPDIWLQALPPIGLALALGGSLFASALSDLITPLKHERVTDPLTQLKNRRNFEDLSHGRLQRHPAYPFSLILLDLDTFKSINDTYGHAAGDATLAETGRIIRDCIRSGDMAWRLGGDEFAILMPGTPAAGAAQVAERIRAQLAVTRLEMPLGDFAVTASFGIAQSWVDEPLYELFARTDILLYAAKRQGRDRITCASGQDRVGARDAAAPGKGEEMLSL
ncbi:MAG: GGDEF domain-containing protein [Alcaligenaceae bacterium]|nr:GGDEF domain-containing protein [Alcaligenaceae bacterium SAGV5]MPS54833.1 GGDEF domain-containing protein [Alcaligenaceae bacterium SAGV3]MPT55449.1 GGDEF domain-containing protein [Alcaligenaceae bacterium]